MTPRSKARKRLHVWSEQGGHCAYCGATLTLTELTLDHVLPKSLGGTNAIDNLVGSCQPCNVKLGNQPPKARILAAARW